MGQDRPPFVLQELVRSLRVTGWKEWAGWRDVNEAAWRGQMTRHQDE